MRITLTMDGGLGFFPGLARPATLDTGSLPAPDRDTLCGLVEAARFFDRPEPADTAPKGGDRRSFTVTVADGGRERTLRVTEPIEDQDLSQLVAGLRRVVKGR